jgi:hypothetical protein
MGDRGWEVLFFRGRVSRGDRKISQEAHQALLDAFSEKLAWRGFVALKREARERKGEEEGEVERRSRERKEEKKRQRCICLFFIFWCST